MWKKARELIERKQTKAYEQAMELLYALKCLACEQDDEAKFYKQTEELVAAYPRQRSLPARMQAAGLLADDDRDKSVKFATKENRWKENHPADLYFDFDLLDAYPSRRNRGKQRRHVDRQPGGIFAYSAVRIFAYRVESRSAALFTPQKFNVH